MLLATIEGETPKVDEELLKWQYAWNSCWSHWCNRGSWFRRPCLKLRRALRPDRFIGPMQKGVGTTRAALGTSGVLGKVLAGTFSPLGIAATLPLHM